MAVLTTHDADDDYTFPERSLIALSGIGDGNGRVQGDDELVSELAPRSVPVGDRVRRLPAALLLTAGYYASRVPELSRVLNGRRNGTH